MREFPYVAADCLVVCVAAWALANGQMASAVAATVGYDVWFYAAHRAFHHPALYAYHKKHHEYVESTRAATQHGSWQDNVVTSLGGILVLVLWPHRIRLPGWIIGTAYTYARGFVHHCPTWSQKCNVFGMWHFGDYHILHHRHFRGNYGQPWLDALLGTALERDPPPPAGARP